MKPLQNNFTTPEQSKRLLELGVPADSANGILRHYAWADCILDEKYWESPMVVDSRSTISITEVLDRVIDDEYDKALPCWSVGRLIELHELIFPEIDNFIIEKDDMSLIERMVRYFEICKEELDFSKLEDLLWMRMN